MVNRKIIFQVLGSLLYIESMMLAIALGVGIFYGERVGFTFGVPILTSLATAALLKYTSRNSENRLGRRDGYVVVSVTWIVFSLIGMMPFLCGGYTDRSAVAFFEAMSGFTTTGTTVFNDLDHMSHAILFWRSLCHWIGGMGIVFFTLAILPGMVSGDQKIFSAESTGLKINKLHPRVVTTARWLWTLYGLLTLACVTAFYFAGMDLFDAVNHAFSTVATGGFSTHTDSIAWFNSATIEYTAVLFMFLASVNFSVLYLLLFRFRFHLFWKEEELRCYVVIAFVAILSMTALLIFQNDFGVTDAVRKSVFNVVSIMTTTGFTTDYFMEWTPATWIILTFVGIIGGCAGSTSGGVKNIRVLTSLKYLIAEFRQALHPRAVMPVRLNDQPIKTVVARSVFAFFTAYVVLLAFSMLFMSCFDISLIDSFGIAISSLSNIGPTIGVQFTPLDAWRDLPDAVLWLNSFLMLAGRLEIFSLILPLIPAFWHEN